MLKVYTSVDEVLVAIDLVLKNRLYVSGWLLSECLVRARRRLLMSKSCAQRCTQYKIALMFKDSLPVAVAFFDRDSSLNMMAFCRVSERRCGHASKCVQALGIDTFSAAVGIEHSRKLWSKHSVDILW